MIELNLIEKKQPFMLPSVLGIDLNSLNFKMIGIAFLIFYIPEIFVRNHFDDKLKSETETLERQTQENNKLATSLGVNKDLKMQLDAYNQQVEKLKSRSDQVDEILRLRTNPKKILEKIARSVPDDLWFNQLKITNDNIITISGGAYTPRSIGEFITIINDSPYFGNSITPVKQENKQELLDGSTTSVENFELKGKIKSYDMRSR